MTRVPVMGLSCIGVLLLAATADAQERRRAPPAQSQNPRAWMEQCTGDVLRQLARTRVPEAQVGPTVAHYCDAPLRAVLAEAIQKGEAALCSVESCIGMARDRVGEEVLPDYRALLASAPQTPPRARRP